MMTYLDLLHDVVSEAEDLPQHSVQLLRAHLARVEPAGLTSTHALYIIETPGQVTTISAGQVEEELSQRSGRVGLALADRSGVCHRLGQVGDRRLGQMVCRLAHERVDEVGTAKRASHEGKDVSSVRRADLDVLADVREDLVVTKVDQG